jgi:Skp family chaperone for outer membrane proteins
LFRTALIVSLVLGILAIAGRPAAALEALPDPIIAVIDMQGVIRDSKAHKSLEEQVIQPFEKELVERQNALREEEQSLKQQRSILSQEAFNQKVREFQTRAQSVQASLRQRKRQVDEIVAGKRQEIARQLFNIIAKIADELNIAVVLNKAQVVIVKKELDISPEAQKRLDEQLPSIEASLPPAQ